MKWIKIFLYLLIICCGYDKTYCAIWKFDETADFSNRKMSPAVSVLISTPSIEGWSDGILLSNDISQAPKIVNDINGIHVVWVDYNDIYYKRSADNGKTWTSDKKLTDNQPVSLYGPGYYGMDFKSCNNILHIVWTDDLSGNSEIYHKRSSDGGNTWTMDKRLTNTTAETLSPSMVADSVNLYVVCVDSPTDGYKLYITTSSDNGDTWCEPFILSTATVFTGGMLCAPRIISDTNGLHLFWNDDRDGVGNKEIYYKRSQDNGKTWTPDINLTNSLGDSRWPYVISDSNGLHLFYGDNKDSASSSVYEMFYKMSDDGGTTWSLAQRLTNVDGYDSDRPRAVVSDNYGLHLFWPDFKYNGYTEVHYKKSTAVVGKN